MFSLIKFIEAKLKTDLSNYLDWSDLMTTYLKVNKIAFEKESSKEDFKPDEEIKRFFIIESYCEAETRRTYLRECESLG
jgi:hypothetical protein